MCNSADSQITKLDRNTTDHMFKNNAEEIMQITILTPTYNRRGGGKNPLEVFAKPDK